MKSTIENLEKQINDEQGRVQARIDELNAIIIEDQSVLNAYVKRFTVAVQDSAGEEELLKLETQRDKALKRVEQNNEIINILSSQKNTKLQRLKAELVGEHLQLIIGAEKDAATIGKQLKEHQKAIFDVFDKLNILRETILEHKLAILAHNNYLSDEDRETLGIPEEGLPLYTLRGVHDPIRQQMVDLIIDIASKALNQYDFNRLSQFFKQRLR